MCLFLCVMCVGGAGLGPRAVHDGGKTTRAHTRYTHIHTHSTHIHPSPSHPPIPSPPFPCSAPSPPLSSSIHLPLVCVQRPCPWYPASVWTGTGLWSVSKWRLTGVAQAAASTTTHWRQRMIGTQPSYCEDPSPSRPQGEWGRQGREAARPHRN